MSFVARVLRKICLSCYHSFGTMRDDRLKKPCYPSFMKYVIADQCTTLITEKVKVKGRLVMEIKPTSNTVSKNVQTPPG